MHIAIGQVWRTRGGLTARVTGLDLGDTVFPWEIDKLDWVTKEGKKWPASTSPNDLVELIQAVAPPEAVEANDSLRAAFEKWATNNDSFSVNAVENVNDFGHFRDKDIASAWESYQAAHARYSGDAKAAARYNYWRSGNAITVEMKIDGGKKPKVTAVILSANPESEWGPSLDAAIDAAMQGDFNV